MSQQKLINEILQRSESKIWDVAKTEWILHEIYEAEEAETCLCGHYPIIELCVIQNEKNGVLATVGNCCVKKFIGLPSNLIFQALKRVRKDLSKSLNEEALKYALAHEWINDWEYKFSIDTMKKRSFSDKQMAVRIKVNEKALRNMKRK